MSQSDPTDHALAAIASILDQPEPHREPEKASVQEDLITAVLTDGEGYSRTGPGPMAAIRFKWTVRKAENGEYFVDETIGENSLPVVSGPLSKDAAIRLVDDREYEARRRFDILKSEMTATPASDARPVRPSPGEI